MPVTKPSATPDKTIDLAVLEQAAGWFATLGDENATDEDRRNWQSWHDQNAAHQAAWQRVEAVGSRFAAVPPEGSNVTRNLLDKGTTGTTNRRNGIKAIALLCTVGLGGWVAQRTQPWHHMLASHSTGTGEQRQYILDDKSTLWLNTATNVNVEYSPTLRRIRVREGEILVQTHADSIMPARPFVVDNSVRSAKCSCRHLGSPMLQMGLR